jgi:hypothetical protein
MAAEWRREPAGTCSALEGGPRLPAALLLATRVPIGKQVGNQTLLTFRRCG